jgi:filamentous hemagglutinin
LDGVLVSESAGVRNLPTWLSGFKAETKFAHYLHYRTDEIVIRWGDGVGTHGADIITVNSKTGRVTLWDTKWRTNPTNIGPSKTFSNSRTLQNAVDQAERALDLADYLPSELRQKAIGSIDSHTFGAQTPGMGAARSSGVQFGPPPL